MSVRVQREDFDVGAEVRRLTAGRTDIGAIVTFTGTVRSGNDGGAISAMTLEHYPGMTETELARVEEGGPLPARAAELLGEAGGLGLSLDLLPAKPVLQRAVQGALAAVAAEPVAARVAAAQRLIEDARARGLRFGLWQTQNRFFEIWQARADARPALRSLGVVLGFNLTGERT